MAYIEWEDDDGTGTLTSSYPAGGTASAQSRRFRSWTPKPVPVGPHRTGLGNGRRYQFQFRVDRRASFEIHGIKPTQFDMWERFRLHALKGCTFMVYTEDAAGRSYTCRIAEESEPELSFADSRMLEYTMSVTVTNVANAPMLCDYTAIGA